MAATEHKFRYLLKPGNDFAFVSRFRMMCIISFLLCAGSIGMLFVNKAWRGSHLNWTIDFKGGTEVIYKFQDKSSPDDKPKYVKADPGKVRAALEKAGDAGFDVSDRSWDENGTEVHGILVRTPRYGATTPEQQKTASDALAAQFADRGIDRMQWSGDRLFVRTKQPIHWDEAKDLWGKAGLEAKEWDAETAKAYSIPDKGTDEYSITFSMHGLDRQYAKVLEADLPGVKAVVEETSQVSAKAGNELRNDGIKSLFYAMLLIVLYLAVRFDIRYAPGAIVATFHDAIMVIGTFAVTWSDVSLTSVAALLTVVGFSVNDTVVIFDRIRENTEKLKDKKLERIVDISLNEVLVRSILTSTTLFVCTLAMNVFGTGLVRNFAFTLNAGIIFGAYSSLYLAPPLFIWISKRWYAGSATSSARQRQAAALAAEP